MTIAAVGAEFWQLTIGNVLTAGLGLVAWGITLGKFKSEITQLRKEQNENTQRLNEFDKTGGLMASTTQASVGARLNDHEGRIRKLEELLPELRTMGVNIEWIIDTLKEMKEAMSDLRPNKK